MTLSSLFLLSTDKEEKTIQNDLKELLAGAWKHNLSRLDFCRQIMKLRIYEYQNQIKTCTIEYQITNCDLGQIN